MGKSFCTIWKEEVIRLAKLVQDDTLLEDALEVMIMARIDEKDISSSPLSPLNNPLYSNVSGISDLPHSAPNFSCLALDVDHSSALSTEHTSRLLFPARCATDLNLRRLRMSEVVEMYENVELRRKGYVESFAAKIKKVSRRYNVVRLVECTKDDKYAVCCDKDYTVVSNTLDQPLINLIFKDRVGDVLDAAFFFLVESSYEEGDDIWVDDVLFEPLPVVLGMLRLLDYITVMNILVASVCSMRSTCLPKLLFSLGALNSLDDFVSVTKDMNSFCKKAQYVNFDRMDLCELSNLTGFRNPPVLGFDVLAECQSLASGGLDHRWNESEFEGYVKEVIGVGAGDNSKGFWGSMTS